MDPEHLKLVQISFQAIRDWQAVNPDDTLDLSGANLSQADMSDAPLGEVDFSLADLSWAKLNGAQLLRADFTRANLTDASLIKANLRGANFTRADLRGTDLRGADLTGADFSSANVSEADLSGARLENADLFQANMSQAKVTGATFKDARCGRTIFSDLDLSGVNDLDTVKHLLPSTLGLDTLVKSLGKIPDVFLRGCGVPERWIASTRGPYRSGHKIGPWVLRELLGKGGNGEVWKATHDSGTVAAIKILRSRDPNSNPYARFRSEVEFLRSLGRRDGILPLLDAHLPDVPSFTDPAWLAMPVADRLRAALRRRKRSLECIVDAVAAIAETLAGLHALGVSHRDLKPDNLFWHAGCWTIGDFGLVNYAAKQAMTKSGTKLGPLHYLAPEMLNRPHKADGRAADVYSLAKTFWVLASGQKFPLPGEFRRDRPNMRISTWMIHPRADAIDQLLETATRDNPQERPSMTDFATTLRTWSCSQRID